MIAKLQSYVIQGIDSIPVTVEVSVSKGLSKFEIIGLADAAIKESKERIFKSLSTAGYTLPPGNITVNLAPAKLKKKGPLYDLPIAVGILIASEQIAPPARLEQYVIAGELSLDEQLRSVDGIFICALKKKEEKAFDLHYLVPHENLRELLSITKKVLAAHSLREAVAFLEQKKQPPAIDQTLAAKASPTKPPAASAIERLDFNEVVGNEVAKLALQLSVISKLNLLFIGPPGSGKSMLMKRLPSILPDLEEKEALTVTRIYKASGETEQSLYTKTPFRETHNAIHLASLIGGGKYPKPGEISLAHKGFLFLDELSEYNKQVLQGLRVPMEKKEVTIHRVEGYSTFPCDFTLLACTNPCACGYYGDDIKLCTCTRSMMAKFYSRLSGPILDRFDMMIFINKFDREDFSTGTVLSSKQMAENILKAKERAKEKEHYFPYANLSLRELFEKSPLFKELIERALSREFISLRKVQSVLKTCEALCLYYGEELNRKILLQAIELSRIKLKFN